MKTETIFTKACLAVSLLAVAGCSSFLDEENLASQSAEQYYATADGYETLITGAYSTLKSVYNTTNYFQLTQLGTDLGTQNDGTATNVLNQYTVDYATDNDAVYNQWKALYEALKNVNAAINRAGSVKTKDQDIFEGIDPDVLAQRVAEAKFLRALYLFEIVKNWGQGPLVLEEPTSPSTTSQLNTGEEFYTQILADLKDVLDSSLPEKQPASEYGRASKAAAKHLRSLVYLTRGYQSYADQNDFRNAFNDAVDVINNSGHQLLWNDYAEVHRQANEANDEIIFLVSFSSGTGWNTCIQSEFYLFVYREGWSDISFSTIYGNDYATVMPTKYAYLLFDWKKDRRTETTFMSPLNADPATSTDGTDRGKPWFESTVGGKVPVGEPVLVFPVPGQDGTEDVYPAGYDAYETYRVYSDDEKAAASANGQYLYNYPQGSIAEGSYGDAENDDYYRTGYQSLNGKSRAWLPVWKFKDANTRYNSSGTVENGTRDIYLFRLAETYLIAAEAAVNLGENGEALHYLNEIRKRARANAPEAGLPDYSGTVTVDDVLDERALELFGESPRWNDLTRTGKLAERVLKYNWDVTHITGGLIQTQLSESTNAKYSLRPIPVDWLNTLSNGQELSNNPGW